LVSSSSAQTPELSKATFTLQHDDGQMSTLDIEAAPVPAAVNGIVTLGLVPVVDSPLSRQKPGEPFWFSYLQESQTMYANFRRYPSLKQNAQALFAAVDRHRPARLVIDLRQNGGGDFFEGREHLIEPIKKRPAINQKGRLFVLVGRQTFSAAMVNAIDFRKETNATLVGEPIGERPNSYSENDEMTRSYRKAVPVFGLGPRVTGWELIAPPGFRLDLRGIPGC
jgi:Peptidase family S41